MKKTARNTLGAGVSVALFAGASLAHAQNSVTLYGVADTGIAYVNHASGSKNAVTMSSGNLSGSRWGLKGSEDLGGGLKSVFQLESGFNINTGAAGQGSRLFGRRAFVGLSSADWGTLTAGRQYEASVDMIQAITGDNYFSTMFTTPGDIDNNDNDMRVNNSIKYLSPNWKGLQVEVVYGFSGLAGQTGQGYTYSGGVSYANGPLNLAAMYMRLTNEPSSGVKRSTWASSADSLFVSPINQGYQSAKSMGVAEAAAQYALGSLLIGASYSNVQYQSDAASSFSGEQHYNVGKTFLAYRFTPAFLGGIGYEFVKASGDTSATYNEISIGADYNLSKLTDVYALAGYQHASGTQRKADGTLQAAVASIGSYGRSGTSSQSMAIVGIRHKF
ncbi:porin [Paraburkholderia sp. Ac-20340]|uniref:porin n=1 Tax=Paraburkholderia sp. Ac-20340 TaxID=2703888 RepID=UPI00197E38D2|nr:porin [Paraburkholderia sp. Ac-20340]MBN3853285.1 porin [Paraburkholderia sp. Ac-20340]